jgi:hypothetical protein
MASNINPYNIDGTFPVANQDNPSQGFRDNFTNIKNNFIYAGNEISDLQAKAIVAQPLTGQTLTNDMAGTQIRRPQLAAWTQTLLDLGVTSGNATLDFNQANFQKLATSGLGSVTNLQFINWPVSTGTGALGYGVMRIWINVQNVNDTIQLPSSVNIADDSLARYDGNGLLSFDNIGDYLFDISSINGGTNFIIQDLTRNRAQFTDTNFYYNIETSSTMYVGFGGGSLNSSNTAVTGYFSEGLQTIQSFDDGQDMLVTFGSINSFGVGNLSLANVAYGQIDTGQIAGLTVSSARGNLLVGSVIPVQPNDIIGYLNAESYTGDVGTGNTFQQNAGIYFFATGSNVTYGLGGNIAFFTDPDGDDQTDIIYQAMGIENDQSIHMYGNLNLSQLGSTSSNSSYVPTHNTSTGTPGQIAWSTASGTTYFYICVSPNSWNRVQLNSTTW